MSSKRKESIHFVKKSFFYIINENTFVQQYLCCMNDETLRSYSGEQMDEILETSLHKQHTRTSLQ